MKNELQLAAEKLLELVEQFENGLISETTLLHEWKQFTRAGFSYLDKLRKEANKNSN